MKVGRRRGADDGFGPVADCIAGTATVAASTGDTFESQVSHFLRAYDEYKNLLLPSLFPPPH